jgi:CRP-like cAMP-binding protein
MSDTLPPIFETVPADHLGQALRHFRRIEVGATTPLMEEGDDDPTLICIADGEVEIETGGVRLGKAGPGDLIGEMALFGDGMRTANVKATTDCTFLVLDRSNYEVLRDAGNLVAVALEHAALAQLIGRLRDMNLRIADLAVGTPAAQVTPDPGVFRRVAKLFGGGGGRAWAWGVDKVGILKKSSLFVNAPEAALKELADKMGAAKFHTGHFVCSQGEFGREMYILGDGLVEVLVALDADRVENVAQLDPGDVFGMASLIEDHPRMASCVSRGDVTCLTLDRDVFLAIKDSQTMAGTALRAALIRGLIDQLAAANGQIALLDFEKKRKTGSFMTGLLRAKASTEAHSQRIAGPPAKG